MILAINIENTNTVIGCFRGEEIVFVESISTSLTRTELEYAISFKNIFELYRLDLEEIEGTIIASVVPPVTNVVREAAMRISGKEVLIIGPGVKTGLNIMMDQPSQVGSDLVANAVAGIAQYPLPLIVVNMGTATTLSVVDAKKHYIGGMIIPGVRISSESLTKGTAQLPQISLEKPRKVIGSNTVECMKSGLIYGTAACIDGSIARIEKELKEKAAAIVATGEAARYIVPHCERKMFLDEYLLLKGLKNIYEKNQKQPLGGRC